MVNADKMMNYYSNDGKKQLDRKAVALGANVCCSRPPHNVCIQTQINRLWALFAGVWPSCLGKCIVLMPKLCHWVLHWQQSERFIPLRLV